MKIKRKIKNSKLSLKALNFDKHSLLNYFIKEYRFAVIQNVEYLWNAYIVFPTKNTTKLFHIDSDLLDTPKYFLTLKNHFKSELSERALACAANQALAIVKIYIQKRKKFLFVNDKLKSEGKRTRNIRKKINKSELEKPDLTNIQEIRLEKISSYRKGKNVGKYLNYFGERLIQRKLIEVAKEHGVHVLLQSSAYRSQRCSHCGYVNRKNRKGKLFSCKRCFFQADADYNASCNHEQNLPSANFLLSHRGIFKEFFWKEEGFFDLVGQELIVPDKRK